MLDFKELQEVDGYAWRNDVSIPMTVSVYNAQFYAIGDKLVPYNEQAPAVQGFEADILRSIGLDPESYAIDNAAWMGAPYQSGETLCRDAVASGRRYAENYRALYESEVALPDAQGWTAVATYEGQSDILSGETEYTVEATAVYQRDDTVMTVIALSVAALILLAAIVIDVYKRQIMGCSFNATIFSNCGMNALHQQNTTRKPIHGLILAAEAIKGVEQFSLLWSLKTSGKARQSSCWASGIIYAN